MSAEPKPMSDKEFLSYCEIHCQSPRAAFVPRQIARLLRLAGREETAKEWDALEHMVIDNYKQKVLKLLGEIKMGATTPEQDRAKFRKRWNLQA